MADETIKLDDDGIPLHLHCLTYNFDDNECQLLLWAYSVEDAQRRVDAMNSGGIELDGQIYARIKQYDTN